MAPTAAPDTKPASDNPEPPTNGFNPYPMPEKEPEPESQSATPTVATSSAPIIASAPEPAATQYDMSIDDDRQPGTYLPEYLVQLILLAILISSITSLFSIGVDSVIPSETARNAGGYGADISSFQLTWSLAGLLSSLPLFLWLFIRTRKVQSEIPEVRNHRWRRGFLGAFIVLQVLVIVSTINGMLFDLIDRAIGQESSGIFSFLASGDKDPWWQVVLVSLLSVAFIGFVVYVMARDYRRKEV